MRTEESCVTVWSCFSDTLPFKRPLMTTLFVIHEVRSGTKTLYPETDLGLVNKDSAVNTPMYITGIEVPG